MAKYLPSREGGEVNIPKIENIPEILKIFPRLKRIIVLVYTHEVISTKSERKPFKSAI